MQIRIYSALPEKEKQVLFELVQECNKVDGGYRLPYLDNNYNTDPEMPAFFVDGWSNHRFFISLRR